ncbi:MAG: hypothetical protein U7123_11120 [Potamolinea sp.]
MSLNLITAGIIDPTQFPIEQVKQEVAAVLNIPLKQIERLECWRHQIWVKIVESRAKLVSYRCLPLWLEQGLTVIDSCGDRPSLDQLGEILRSEREWYDEHEQPEAVQPWRDAWGAKAAQLREAAAILAAEEERLKPIRAREQTGWEWQSAWKQILKHCQDLKALLRLAPEMRQQTEQFEDLPEVVQGMHDVWKQRWQELSQRSA